MRRGSLVQLVLIALVLAGVAVAVALFVPWLPEAASRERGRIDFVYWLTTGICIFVFALVAAVSAYAVWKFRVRPDDDTDGPPIHGHTGLEIAWTAVPAVLVTAIALASAVALAQNDSQASDALTVEVTARQFAWTFSYPDYKAKGEPLTSATLRLPVDRQAELRITSLDVIHSFWVPEFGQKQDAVPGIFTETHVTPTHLGTFPVICTELCGLGHSYMRSQVQVMTASAFGSWAKGTQKKSGGTSGQAGATVFAEQGCGSCHTFKPAGSTGTTGPDLDTRLPQDAKKAGQPLEAFTRQSIVSPDAFVAPGFPPNVMPKTYSQLPKQQLDALVQYLTGSTGKGAK